eukprot:TRINITY_DN5479_c0_g1_i3.p1 TRINITY_DN5479_c0_g1~~TRINITY_DN5479_c0_g1_i3.p1  ORF type:complete len:476 (-),score=66.58 TRINITY_DN5479_c0_g1_i3:132-1538(-)
MSNQKSLDKVDNQQNDPKLSQAFSIGYAAPDYSKDAFFTSFEQHLEATVNPSGTYPQLNASYDVTTRRQSIKKVSTIEERHARAMEKNRQAQKRFRDKQKVKINMMESQVDKLASKVEQLELEKQQLQEQLRQSYNSEKDKEPIDQAAETEEVRKVEGTYYMKSIGRELTSDMIRNIHLPEFKAYFLETMELLIQEISKRVEEADVPDASREKIEKLEEIVEDERACMLRMFIINPVGAKSMGSMQFRNQCMTAEQFKERVQTTVDKMELSVTQKSVIAFLWKRYCELQADCTRQRKEIAGSLSDADAGKKTQADYYQQFTRTHELVFRVRENWRQDYKNHWDLMNTIALHILSPLQFGRMIYYMEPCVMDFFLMCQIIAEKADIRPEFYTQQQITDPLSMLESDEEKRDPGLFIFGSDDSLNVSDLLNSSLDVSWLNAANVKSEEVEQQVNLDISNLIRERDKVFEF